MLTLLINTDEYKLYTKIEKQMKLKRELLGRYRGDTEVEIQDKGKTIEKIKLDELFTE